MTYTHIALADTSPAPILAAGAWFSNVVCGLRDNVAQLSPVLGDLADADACIAHERAMANLLDWLGPPRAIAHDLHPDFHSSRHAVVLAAQLGAQPIAVQHHHAHIAAVCAEHGEHGPVIGLALDGVGLGTDQQAWGGELLQVHGAQWQRLGHFMPLALPGGDRAAREPWRMAASLLHEMGQGAQIAARFADQPAAATVTTMLAQQINCPRTSSAGRVFDAAAGLLGLCPVMRSDAEAAIALEQAASGWIANEGWPSADPADWRIDAQGVLDLRPLLARLVNLPTASVSVAQAAARFHATLVAALSDWAQRACATHGIGVVACGGGCFFNRLLREGLRRELAAAGLRALMPMQVSPGDAGLALGQAWVALHQLEQ